MSSVACVEDSVSFVDGCNNEFTVTASGFFTFRPVTAVESSSGCYSGGEPLSRVLTHDEFESIRHGYTQTLSSLTEFEGSRRTMGTGILRGPGISGSVILHRNAIPPIEHAMIQVRDAS
jgi:hypothetical protein